MVPCLRLWTSFPEHLWGRTSDSCFGCPTPIALLRCEDPLVASFLVLHPFWSCVLSGRATSIYVYGQGEHMIPSSCPECGCTDVERIGNRRTGGRFLCFEGHQFEIPQRRSFFAKWRHRNPAGRQVDVSEHTGTTTSPENKEEDNG